MEPIARRRVLAFVAVAALAGLSACASLRSAEPRPSDAEITSEIERELAADPETSPFEFDVETEGGVVRLGGIVETQSERQIAGSYARATEGVTAVINEIQLGDVGAREVESDDLITTRVNSRLAAAPGVSVLGIDVATIAGVVTLWGRVETPGDKEVAEKIALATPGVKDVRNRLEVTGG